MGVARIEMVGADYDDLFHAADNDGAGVLGRVVGGPGGPGDDPGPAGLAVDDDPAVPPDHGIGDEVLKFIADKLRESIRERDIAARIGGDEFLPKSAPWRRRGSKGR